MTQSDMSNPEALVTDQEGSNKSKKSSQLTQLSHRGKMSMGKDIQNGLETDSGVSSQDPVQEILTHTADSDSQDSSGHAYAEPPSFGDVGDELSETELSDLEVLIHHVTAFIFLAF